MLLQLVHKSAKSSVLTQRNFVYYYNYYFITAFDKQSHIIDPTISRQLEFTMKQIKFLLSKRYFYKKVNISYMYCKRFICICNLYNIATKFMQVFIWKYLVQIIPYIRIYKNKWFINETSSKTNEPNLFWFLSVGKKHVFYVLLQFQKLFYADKHFLPIKIYYN